MKDTLLTLARHTFAALAGMLAHVSIHADATNTGSIIAGVLCFSIAWLWSVSLKIEINDEGREMLQKFCAALASQFVAALSGWLALDAPTVNDPAALSLFLGNLALSRLRGHVPPAKLGQWTSLLILSACSVCSVGCSSSSQAALKARLEAAFISAGREVSVVALQGTITTLKQELALLEARPVDNDPMQQLLDQNRMAAIKAAIKLGEERLRTLNMERSTSNIEAGGKAVIEVNPVNKVR